MEVLNDSQLSTQAFQPLKLLSRFRARVSALTSWEAALPVEVEANGDGAALKKYACDIACTCLDATPAETLIDRRANALESRDRNALLDVYQRLRAIHSIGSPLPHRYHLRRMIAEAFASADAALIALLTDFVAGPLNDALCREQALGWLEGSPYRIHLYGPGWNQHEKLSAYARQLPENDDELPFVFRAATINLRLTPCPASHPLLASGISSGGFYLMRFFPQDVVERIFRPLFEFCRDNNIDRDKQLKKRATPTIQRLIDFVGHTLGVNVFDAYDNFVGQLSRSAAGSFSVSAGGLWEEYDSICFGSREQLLSLVHTYLNDAPQRRRIAASMRRRLLERTSADAAPATAEAARGQ